MFQPAKDAWDSAFCVGTSFLVRRDRLEEIGGFPHEAVSEDINLTYTMMRHGYVTRWLNERLSVGLAAEGLPEYITQRARWCLGTIQVALLRNGPFTGSGLTLVQRIQYLHGLLNWLCKPFIVLMLLAPSVYWFFDVPAFEADYVAFLRSRDPGADHLLRLQRLGLAPPHAADLHGGDPHGHRGGDHLDLDHLLLQAVRPPVQGDRQGR